LVALEAKKKGGGGVVKEKKRKGTGPSFRHQGLSTRREGERDGTLSPYQILGEREKPHLRKGEKRLLFTFQHRNGKKKEHHVARAVGKEGARVSGVEKERNFPPPA